jgi:hypothetical protein
MGLDVNGARFLLYAQNLGADFSSTAMIGRQSLYADERELQHAFATFGRDADEQSIRSIVTDGQGYAEPLLKNLGAREIHSLDNSPYEGATHIHDMNRPIPDDFKERYSLVLDGGSLEHMFDFPTAIRNCMEMVAVGGHYLGITPTNNYLGHGFYQFSPELFYSIFTRENGFELVSMVAMETKPWATWYAVANPRDVRGRVTLINTAPVLLLFVARRIARASIFESTPQQSDYLALWNQSGGEPSGSQGRGALLSRIQRSLPGRVKRLLRPFLRRRGFDRRFFQPFDPAKPRLVA